jgi:hypothetical protein
MVVPPRWTFKQKLNPCSKNTHSCALTNWANCAFASHVQGLDGADAGAIPPGIWAPLNIFNGPVSVALTLPHLCAGRRITGRVVGRVAGCVNGFSRGHAGKAHISNASLNGSRVRPGNPGLKPGRNRWRQAYRARRIFAGSRFQGRRHGFSP